MKYFSTFTGIGWFELGIIQAYERLCDADRGTKRGGKEDQKGKKGQGLLSKTGKNSRTAKGSASKRFANGSYERPLCVGYSEIDKYACQIYEKRFPNHKNYGDITKIDERKLPDFDLLVGGFPCQSFSIAGKRGGFSDTRGTLFFDLARILKAKRPRLFIFENVKGLLSHDEGRTFATIISTLDELGYDLQWQVLNSKHFGVPQNRERVFIVGHLRGTRRPEVFPFRFTDSELPEANQNEKKVQHIAQTLTARQFANNSGNYIKVGTLRNRPGEARFREIKERIAPALNARAREDDDMQPVVCIPEATKKGYAEARPGQSINLSVPNSKTRRGRVSNVAQTLDTGMQQYTLTKDAKIRRLTPIECERLQGFPDGWTEGVSDSQRYKCLGNAVTVNVIQAIVSRMV